MNDLIMIDNVCNSSILITDNMAAFKEYSFRNIFQIQIQEYIPNFLVLNIFEMKIAQKILL